MKTVVIHPGPVLRCYDGWKLVFEKHLGDIEAMRIIAVLAGRVADGDAELPAPEAVDCVGLARV